MKMNKWILLATLAILAIPQIGLAQEPLEALKEPMERVLAILQSPEYQSAEGKAKQKEELFAATQEIFDYIEIAKRAVGRKWRDFTPQERKSFVDAFSKVLQNTYVSKVQSEFHDERVDFLEQQNLSKTKALVKTHIISKDQTVQVDYRMLFKNDKWRVYDVIVEGISLVKNYRTQFNDILAKETPAQLIERLNQKLADIERT